MLIEVLDTQSVAKDLELDLLSRGNDAEVTQVQETDAEEDSQFTTKLLSALAAMAVRSKRRQADLSAAVQRAGIRDSAQRIMAALRHLEEIGCIEDLVPLYDGGILMSVTSRGIEQLNTAPRWSMSDHQGYRFG